MKGKVRSRKVRSGRVGTEVRWCQVRSEVMGCTQVRGSGQRHRSQVRGTLG